MYYFIKGKLIKKDENFIVAENSGIGYKIYTSSTSMSAMGDTGSIITMYTYLHVREDIFDLYGFATEEERTMFLHLLSVSGVGPKAALAVLSVAPPAKIAIAVITNDSKLITKAQGVGPKMAQRIILELKDKLKTEELELETNDAFDVTEENGSFGEAVSALIVLGYSANDARRAIEKAGTSGSIEDIIKRALVQLM